MLCHARSHGEAAGVVRRQKGVKGKPRPELLFRIASPKKARQGRGNSLGIGQIEQWWQAMGYKVGLQLSDTWSWVIQSRRYIGLVCESQIKEVVEGSDLGLIGLHMKSGLTNRVLLRSKNVHKKTLECSQQLYSLQPLTGTFQISINRRGINKLVC